MLGNKDKINQLRRLANAGMLSHAYIFTGESGMGKKSLATEVCLSLFCEDAKDGVPCGKCPGCKKVLSGNHPDIIRVTHEKPASVSVDDIRDQVNDTVAIKPYSRTHKVYIIDEAEKMTPQAQNALLKTLEEPPGYVNMLLLCSDEKKFLDTILSRCVRVRMERIPEDEIRDFLVSEGTERETADICASFSGGNPGKALRLSGSEEFKETYKKVLGLLKNMGSMTVLQFLELARELISDGTELSEVLDLITLWYRDVLFLKTFQGTGKLTYRGEQAALRKFAEAMSVEKVASVLLEVENVSKRLKSNVNKELTMELLFVKMKESGR